MTKQQFMDGAWFRPAPPYEHMVFRFDGKGGVGYVVDITGKQVGKVDLWTNSGCRIKAVMVNQEVRVLLKFSELTVAVVKPISFV